MTACLSNADGKCRPDYHNGVCLDCGAPAGRVHPRHDVMAEVAPGLWDVARPIHPTGVLGWQTRRACRRAGGHWWHPDHHDITAWWCCACGAPGEGMPEDGNSTWRLYFAHGRRQVLLGIWRHRPDRVSPEYRWVGLTWQL